MQQGQEEAWVIQNRCKKSLKQHTSMSNKSQLLPEIPAVNEILNNLFITFTSYLGLQR